MYIYIYIFFLYSMWGMWHIRFIGHELVRYLNYLSVWWGVMWSCSQPSPHLTGAFKRLAHFTLIGSYTLFTVNDCCWNILLFSCYGYELVRLRDRRHMVWLRRTSVHVFKSWNLQLKTNPHVRLFHRPHPSHDLPSWQTWTLRLYPSEVCRDKAHSYGHTQPKVECEASHMCSITINQ